MTEAKTKPTTQSISTFIKSVESEEKQKDVLELIKVFENSTLEKAIVWGTSIIGFGIYETKSGTWPLVSFSPRKQNLTLYIGPRSRDQEMLKSLGKHKVSGGCLHINKLDDIDLDILQKLIEDAYIHMKELNK